VALQYDPRDRRDGDVDADGVLAQAFRTKCSTYDGEYVALAKILGVPRVTTD
jgi:predicted nucleic acid-binding protein